MYIEQRSGNEALAYDRSDDASEEREGMFAVDFQEIWAAVYRSRIWIAAILAVCLVIGVAITLLTTPIYRATSTIQINQEAAKVLGTEQTESSASIQDAERFLKTQIDIIKSRTVATAVAQDLRLFGNDRFLETMGINPDIKGSATLTAEQARREVVLAVLAKNLSVLLPRDSRIASISFETPDPELSARITNSYVENFIRSNLQRKFETSAYAREFLDGQLRQAQARLEQSERAAVAFASRTRIIDTSNASQGGGVAGASGPRSLVTAMLVQLNAEYASAMARRIGAEQEWRRASETAPLNVPDVASNLAVQNLLDRRAELQVKYEEEAALRKPDFPTVRQAAARVAEIDAQIKNVSSTIRNSVRTRYDVALAQEAAVRRQVDVLKSMTLSEQNQSIQLSILRREADTNRQQFDALLGRYNQLNAEAGVQTNNISVIDRATAPTFPSWPKIPLNIALSLIVGVALSAAYVFGREQLFGTVRTPDDVTQRLGYPLLGAVPDVAGDREDVAAALQDPKSEIAEAFNSVRAALSLSSKSGAPRTITFVSTQKGEGKSTVCYATGAGFGKIGKRVLIVDLDLRIPNQNRLFGLPNKAGMSNVLADSASLDEVILSTSVPGVSLLPSGPIPPDPTDLLTSDRLPAVIQQLLDRFDMVLIDSPPVLGLADAVIIGSMVESVVYVVQSGRNNPKGLQSALKRLRQGSAKIAGIVLSRFDPEHSGYSYMHNYAYHYQYKS